MIFKEILSVFYLKLYLTVLAYLNPRAFEEMKYMPVQPVAAKKIAVIGGRIVGMEFAIQASKRGYAIILYEKSGRLGGVFNENMKKYMGWFWL